MTMSTDSWSRHTSSTGLNLIQVVGNLIGNSHGIEPGWEAPQREAENQRWAGDEPPSAKSGSVSSSASWQVITYQRIS